MQRFQNQCLQSATYVVNPHDSLFVTFGDEQSLRSEYDTVMLERLFENAPDCGHFIPNFKHICDFLSNDTKHSQFSPNSFVFYVMKFGDDFVLPQDYEYNWDLLPDRIKHGYSSGIAFDKSTSNRIYCWTIAW